MRSPPRLASFGNITIDSVTTHGGGRSTAELGGDCVYAAVGARIWGAAIRVVGVAGRDYPEEWFELLRAGGVDTAHVRRVPEPHTMIARMNYDRHDRRENEWTRPARRHPAWPQLAERWRAFSPTVEDARECRPWADCVHIAAMPVDRQNDLLRYFAGAVDIVTLDIPWSPETMSPLDLPEVGLASAVFMSDAELKGHYGNLGIESAVDDLRARGAKLVTIKHGRRGSAIYHESGRSGQSVPAIETLVVDPTGAGDAYCGGFSVGLWESGDPVLAAMYGTVSASFVIEGFGAGYALGLGTERARARLASLQEQVGPSSAG